MVRSFAKVGSSSVVAVLDISEIDQRLSINQHQPNNSKQ